MVILFRWFIARGWCAVVSTRSAGRPLGRKRLRRRGGAIRISRTVARAPTRSIATRIRPRTTPGPTAGRSMLGRLGRLTRSTRGTGGRRVSGLGRSFCGLRGTRLRTTGMRFASGNKGVRSFITRRSPARRRFGHLVKIVGRGHDGRITRLRHRGRRGLRIGLSVVRRLGRLIRSKSSTGGSCARFGGLRRR